MNKLRLFFLSRRSWTLPYLIFSIIFVIVFLLFGQFGEVRQQSH
jgi:spermidine/putrescine transport system permease protein